VAPCLTRRRTPRWAPLSDRIRELIHDRPDLTLRELKAELKTDLSVHALCVALQRLRLTVKKKCSSPRNGNGLTSRSGGRS
jgi:transposase